MNRSVLIVLLTLGTVLGFGAGFARLRHHRTEHAPFGAHYSSHQQHWAALCASAALDANARSNPARQAPR